MKIFRSGGQFFVKILAVLAYQRIFHKLVNRQFVLTSSRARSRADVPPVVVECLKTEVVVGGNSNRVEVTRDGFFKIGDASLGRFFDAAFGNAVRFKSQKGAGPVVEQGRTEAPKVGIKNIKSFICNDFQALWSEEGFDVFVNIFEGFHLFRIERSAKVPLPAASALAGAQVAAELFSEHLVTYKNVLNDYQNEAVLPDALLFVVKNKSSLDGVVVQVVT